MLIFLLLLHAGWSKSLQGQVAVITGASSGIGAIAAKELAARGMHVVLAARRTSNLLDIVKEINSKGGSAVAKKCDVSVGADVKKMFAFAEELYGAVDFVFANAAIDGAHQKIALQDTDDEMLHEIYTINVVGTFYTLKYAVQSFKRNGGGTIAFSSSIASLIPSNMNYSAWGAPPGSLIAYHSTKQAVDRIAMDAWSSYRNDNVNVYNFNIAAFTTEMGSRLGFGSPGEPCPINPLIQKYGNPVTIAEVILAILDGTSKWQPGSALLIDNDATINARYFYDQIYNSDTKQDFIWKRSVAEMRKLAFDVKGNPYNWKDEL